MSLAAQERSSLSELLVRSTDNSAFYAALTGADRVHEINEVVGLRADPRYRLIRVDHRLGKANNIRFEIALLDDIELSVAYYNKVTLMRAPGVNTRQFAHNIVWRSPSSRHSLALRDISYKVLFNYIIQNYDIFLAADLMTDGGIFHWHRLVSRAVKNGLHAYVYDAATQALQPIPTQYALNEIQDQAWSGTNQEAMKAIISTSPLELCHLNCDTIAASIFNCLLT